MHLRILRSRRQNGSSLLLWLLLLVISQSMWVLERRFFVVRHRD